MKQRAHAWVTLRAFKLLDDSRKAPKLTEMLSYYLSDVWNGAWLPDVQICDIKYGHIYKMDDDYKILGLQKSELTKRYLSTYKSLKSNLKGTRLCLDYVKDWKGLDKPYRSHPEKGGHLPDRVLALSHTIADMLKLSDYPIPFYVKGKAPKTYRDDLSGQKVKNLSLSPNFSARQIALMFFLLSHYICDAHMPLHCDLRNSSKMCRAKRLSDNLHKSIESTWEEWFPDIDRLIIHDYTKDSIDNIVAGFPPDSEIAIDTNEIYKLNTNRILKLKKDVWREMVYITRISHAVSRKLIKKPYSNAQKLIDDIGDDEFKDITNRIFHDAVESIARIWFKVWENFKQ